MKKILTIIGARPQIIKAAAISRAINNHFSHDFVEIIVHTGQHYDENMSKIFFEELQIPKPNYNLNVGSGKHGEQTAKMITGIEKIIEYENPDYVILYGDTNSTLAGAIAASKIHIPIVHIEAGLRSYNKSMPEEINRILTDHVSTFLFSPTELGLSNLNKEGFSISNTPPYSFDNPKIMNVGDVMYDNSMFFKSLANDDILIEHGLKKMNYVLMTLHRNNNTDDPRRLNTILETIIEVAQKYQIDLILPIHPRTMSKISEVSHEKSSSVFQSNRFIKIVPPVSYLEMISLEANSRFVITDSGGVQKEAYFFNKPCIILRSETEWVEIVENEMAFLADDNKDKIISYSDRIMTSNIIEKKGSLYGDGNAAEKILDCLKNFI